MKINFTLFRNLGFKKKLILSYIVLLLIPLLLGAIYFYTSAVASVRQKTEAMMDQLLNQETSNIGRKLEEFEKVAQNISQNSMMNDFFNGFYSADSEFILFINNNVQPLISWWMTSNPGISELRYYTYNRNISSYYLYYPAQNYDGQSWFQQMKQVTDRAAPYWETLHETRQNGGAATPAKKVFSLFYPIILPNVKDNTYLEIEVSPAYLFRQINDTQLGRSGFLFVTDPGKDILQASNPSLCKSLLDSIDAGILADWQKNSHFTGTVNGTKYLVSVSGLAKTDTLLVAALPSSEVTQNLSYARNLYILILVASLAVLAGIAYFLAGILMKKVKKLVSAVHRIQNQDFNIHIPVNGKDEIDELANDINIMSAKINDLINKVYKSEIAQREAELAALQMQINPHFLFNTLEILKMMAEIEEQYKISDAIASLGNLIRYNLAKSNGTVCLSDELENIRDYATIQNLLLNNKLKLQTEIPEELLPCEIPNLMLQPLVENSILHGYKNRRTELVILIRAVRENERLVLQVRDNGSGIPGERLAEIRKCLAAASEQKLLLGRSHGIALTNIHNRICLRYGDSYGVEPAAGPDSGTDIRITLPYREPEAQETPTEAGKGQEGEPCTGF